MATIDTNKQDVTDLVISKRPISFKITKANIIKYDESKKLLYVSSFSSKTFKDKISDNDPETPDKELENSFNVLTPIIIPFTDSKGVEMRLYNGENIMTENSDENIFIRISTVLKEMIDNPNDYYLEVKNDNGYGEPAYVKSKSNSKIVLDNLSVDSFIPETENNSSYYNTFIGVRLID